MQISIVIPTYNEKENLPELIKKIVNVFEKNNLDGNVIVVDDNSPDGTGHIADQLAEKDHRIQVIHRKGKLGIGTAHIAGFKHALKHNNSDLIFSMDSDLSHDPKYLPDFINMHEKGFDVIVGSRYVDGGGVVNWGLYRKAVSKGANVLASTLLGVKVHDMTTGYRCYDRRVLEKLDLDSIKSNGYSFLEEILFFCKKEDFSISETPIIFVDRAHGKSKLSKKEMIKFFLTILRLRFGHI